MMKRRYIFILIFFVSISANAQRYSGIFYGQWNIFTPLTDKEYVSKTSAAGLRLGFTKFMSDQFSYGIEGSYSIMHEYIPRRTYQYSGGAFTSDFYDYLYYYTIMANSQYYFTQGDKLISYASMGMGVSFTNYRVFYNVYEGDDTKTGFVARPEVGIIYKIKDDSNWGIKSSISYDYAVSNSEKLGVDNLSGISFHIGIAFFRD